MRGLTTLSAEAEDCFRNAEAKRGSGQYIRADSRGILYPDIGIIPMSDVGSSQFLALSFHLNRVIIALIDTLI